MFSGTPTEWLMARELAKLSTEMRTERKYKIILKEEANKIALSRGARLMNALHRPSFRGGDIVKAAKGQGVAYLVVLERLSDERTYEFVAYSIGPDGLTEARRESVNAPRQNRLWPMEDLD